MFLQIMDSMLSNGASIGYVLYITNSARLCKVLYITNSARSCDLDLTSRSYSTQVTRGTYWVLLIVAQVRYNRSRFTPYVHVRAVPGL